MNVITILTYMISANYSITHSLFCVAFEYMQCTIDMYTEELCLESIVFLLLRLILNEQNMLAG